MQRIAHFGADECARVLVLSRCGYQVNECGTSVSELQSVLQNTAIDAIAVSEDLGARQTTLLDAARSVSSAPIVLFEGVQRSYDPAGFDLVIPFGTPAPDWLESIAAVIERSRALLEAAAALREQSVTLRRQSAATRQEAVKERDAVERERAKTKNLDTFRAKSAGGSQS